MSRLTQEYHHQRFLYPSTEILSQYCVATQSGASVCGAESACARTRKLSSRGRLCRATRLNIGDPDYRHSDRSVEPAAIWIQRPRPTPLRQSPHEIRDLLLAPPVENAYATLKETLVRRVTPSEPQRLQQLLRGTELGDRTPSQLLRHMQQLLGETSTTIDGVLLRELFLQKLPSGVRMVIAASEHKDLTAAAELADKLVAMTPPTPMAAVQARQPLNELQEMRTPGRPRSAAPTSPQTVHAEWTVYETPGAHELMNRSGSSERGRCARTH
ncbi:hypothetical protein HPB50_008966 [Hyalomma asiaticum]|uniref:Uncharacterized protein n=1 Tax=Hyalomma asiaticum TaxID=266040 RepID=A0ACB7RYQ1_HYAAI|nr:hypothetical protein HPB50_008966 [Hyalomma asiaticum]